MEDRDNLIRGLIPLLSIMIGAGLLWGWSAVPFAGGVTVMVHYWVVECLSVWLRFRR